MRVSYTLLLGFFLFYTSCLGELYKPRVPIPCSKDSRCPKEWPCCSPYGECGAGPVCVGGCNPRWSFDERACLPASVIMHPFAVEFDSLDIASKLVAIGEPEDAIVALGNYNGANGLFRDGTQPGSPELTSTLESRGFIHFTKYLVTEDVDLATSMFKNTEFTYSGYTEDEPSTGDILLKMPKRTTGALIASTREFLYGRASVTMKTARSQGVITALVLISQVGDEIDFEFLGGSLNSVQTNFFYQGGLDYTKMKSFQVDPDISQSYHKYEIDWTEDRIQWFIDGQLKRTVYKTDTWDSEANTYKYPQTPVRLEIAVWPGGDEKSPPGTVEWAGGYIDWDNAPDIVTRGYFAAQIHKIRLQPFKNRHIREIVSCLSSKLKKIITNKYLTTVSVGYDRERDNTFAENSLEWYCNAIPYTNGWLRSRNMHELPTENS